MSYYTPSIMSMQEYQGCLCIATSLKEGFCDLKLLPYFKSSSLRASFSLRFQQFGPLQSTIAVTNAGFTHHGRITTNMTKIHHGITPFLQSASNTTVSVAQNHGIVPKRDEDHSLYQSQMNGKAYELQREK